VHGLVGSSAWASNQAGLARSNPATWVARSNPATWAGLGPARKIILQKNSFKKICDFPQIFYCILINISLYFYTVKIQIRY